MTIDWRRLLADHRVPFVERGANVSRGEINIQCPFCGSADPSQHMGLNLQTGFWACWRNAEHRGKSPVRLLVRLLRVSVKTARELAGLDDTYVDPDGFANVVQRLLYPPAKASVETRPPLDFPNSFRAITTSAATARHWRYLEGRRGFEDVAKLCADYELCADIGGKWEGRIVLPYIVGGELVAWSGRAIGRAELRYRDLDSSECRVQIRETFYNVDATTDCTTALVIVEGPFDALKLDHYGKEFGVRAVALSTNSISEDQLMLIHEVSYEVPRVLVMLDTKSTLGIVDSMRMRQRLAGARNVSITSVPFNAGDAGELSPREVRAYCKELQCSTK